MSLQSLPVMLMWTASFVCLYFGLRSLWQGFAVSSLIFTMGRERLKLNRVADLLRELEETLSGGLVPNSVKWEQMKALPDPWGVLAHESLQELRTSGGALLPTLRRIRALAQEHCSALSEARARSSQALAQALACGGLVPLFGGVLYILLPGVSGRPWLWGAACLLGVMLAGLGALWMLSLAERARWGGLSTDHRNWVLAAQCSGERFLALVRGGNPADIAWSRACELLARLAPDLARQWRFSVWGSESQMSVANKTKYGGSAVALIEAGSGLRKAVQVSLMEGRPCTDRVETVLQALRREIDAQIERELSLLSTRTLKPLFVCVAPALFSLLVLGLWLSWEAVV